MSKRQLLCVLGVWVTVFLFLGFPIDWDKGVAVITGLIILVVAYTLPTSVPQKTEAVLEETFVEHKQP